MARTADFFLGADGDKVLSILSRGIVPRFHDGWTYFSTDAQQGFMHGADRKRGKAFVILVTASLTDEPGAVIHTSTPGVRNTVMVRGDVRVRVKSLIARFKDEDGRFQTETVNGDANIRSYLK